jgi:hypothetical protein
MHFFDADGTVHEQEQPNEPEEVYEPFEPQPVKSKHKYYREQSPWRKRPNVKHADKYFQKRKSSYMTAQRNAIPQDNYDEHVEISRLQKQLSDQINDNVWKEKECTRLQECIKHLQEHNQASRRHANSLERAFIAIVKDGNPIEVSVAESDAEHDDDNPKNSYDNTHDYVTQMPSTYQ